jgi:small neutral amino acid transporter SnatA (MarC family)
MVLFVVKILPDGVRRAMESDVLASVLSMHFGKFQRILKSFEISVNISSVGEGICCAYSAVHMAQDV